MKAIGIKKESNETYYVASGTSIEFDVGNNDKDP